MVLLYHLSGILETLNAWVRRKLLVPPARDAEPDATVSQTCVPPAQKLLARRCQPERDLGPHEFFGGNMLRRSDALMAVAFFCVLSVLVMPAHSQDPRQGRGGGGRGQVALPDGPGKEEVQTQCTKCHALGLIANSGGNTKQEWAELFGTMVQLPNVQRDAIAEYLAKNYPPQPRPQPVVVPGAMSVSFKEWNVPTLG